MDVDESNLSHPTRVRGLKCQQLLEHGVIDTVAPYTGAWIEISVYGGQLYEQRGAPYTGAWIEIAHVARIGRGSKSHPTRVRGLKYAES